MSGDATISVGIILAPESVEAIARRIVEMQGEAKRPEMSVAEAMQLTGHRCRRTFEVWCKRVGVRSKSRGRYRRSSIMRALGGGS